MNKQQYPNSPPPGRRKIEIVLKYKKMNIENIKSVYFVGAGGIGAPLIFAMNAYRWEEAGAILAGLIVLVLIVEWISTKIRVKLARG